MLYLISNLKKLHIDPRRQLVLENEINVPPKSEMVMVWPG